MLLSSIANTHFRAARTRDQLNRSSPSNPGTNNCPMRTSPLTEEVRQATGSFQTGSRSYNHNDSPSNNPKPLIPSQGSATVHATLTEASLIAHDLAYDEAEASFQTEVRIRELQKTGRKLGVDLPLHCYEKDQWQRHEWIEEQARAANQR